MKYVHKHSNMQRDEEKRREEKKRHQRKWITTQQSKRDQEGDGEGEELHSNAKERKKGEERCSFSIDFIRTIVFVLFIFKRK